MNPSADWNGRRIGRRDESHLDGQRLKQEFLKNVLSKQESHLWIGKPLIRSEDLGEVLSYEGCVHGSSTLGHESDDLFDEWLDDDLAHRIVGKEEPETVVEVFESAVIRLSQASDWVAAEDEIGGDGFGEHLGDEELSDGSGGVDSVVLEQKLRKRNGSLDSLEISNVSPLEIEESLNEGGSGSVGGDGLLEVQVSVEP